MTVTESAAPSGVPAPGTVETPPDKSRSPERKHDKPGERETDTGY
jgi:hypothetical protein